MARGNFGERLKREREMREVSLNEVTVATRIGPRFLEALENEDWEKLPGGVFNRGFVRAIARYLGLDEENLLAEYDMARAGGQQKTPAPVAVENHLPRASRLPFALGVLLVLLIVAGLVAAGLYGWRRYTARHAKESSSVSTEITAPMTPASLITTDPVPHADVSGSPSAPAIPAAPLDLSVSASASTRVRILGDGKLLADAELHTGETRHFAAQEHFQVTAADSSAVLLELNGQAMPPLGEPGASGTIVLSQKDLRQAPGGNTQP